MTEKFLMARNFYRFFTENNPVMGDSKTFGIPEAKGLSRAGGGEGGVAHLGGKDSGCVCPVMRESWLLAGYVCVMG